MFEKIYADLRAFADSSLDKLSIKNANNAVSVVSVDPPKFKGTLSSSIGHTKGDLSSQTYASAPYSGDIETGAKKTNVPKTPLVEEWMEHRKVSRWTGNVNYGRSKGFQFMKRSIPNEAEAKIELDNSFSTNVTGGVVHG